LRPLELRLRRADEYSRRLPVHHIHPYIHCDRVRNGRCRPIGAIGTKRRAASELEKLNAELRMGDVPVQDATQLLL
jgi:hypothetical protein